MNWGTGYTTGLSAGVYNAIHRINDMRSKLGSDLDIDMVVDYLTKDSEWEMRDIEGWNGSELMESANGWTPGWWNADSN
jgi:hypothetical protein